MYLNSDIIQKIDAVFSKALGEGRKVLYEFEVYEIMKALGIQVPNYVFVKDINDVTKEALSKFGNEIVLKIVSAEISHKQKVGGVKKINNTEELYVQFVLNKMKEDVLSHFTGQKPSIKGFLIVDFIEHSQAIGYETLFGLKEDFAFGPVLTLSKGGDDAEFFAKYYDPANIFLPPLSLDEAKKFVNTLHIRKKFESIGHPEYIDFMAHALHKISLFAWEYSFCSNAKSEYIIKALDINPIVISKDNEFVVIDGYAEFIKREENTINLPNINISNLDAFFNPKGIAVIGVSADVTKYSLGREIAHLLHDLGRDDIYFINQKGGSIAFDSKEYQLYKSISDLPVEVDLVVYTAPAKFTIDLFKELHGKNVKGVILISGIPQDIKYSDFAKELDKVVPANVRVIGPNCMGIFYAPDKTNKGLNTLFIEQKRLEIKYNQNSNAVLITQSGALAVTEIDKLQNAKLFKSIVSFGNKYDVKITDLLSYFANNKDVDVLSLYIEGFDAGEGRRFFEISKDIKKPIIVYKSGRTDVGAKAAASHTASMTGSYDVFKAACDQAGIITAENIEDHYDYIKVFSLLSNKLPKGNKVSGVVNAGFESTVGADELRNLEVAKLSSNTIKRLNEINKYGLVDTNAPFLDITPMADDKMYADYVEAILQDDNVDSVFVAVVPHTITLKTIPENCHDPEGLANLLVNLHRKYSKPMVVSVNAGRYYQDFITIMEDAGIPVYTDIRAAIKSLDAFVSFHLRNK